MAHAETLPPDRREAFVREAAAQPWELLQGALGRRGAGPPPVLRPPQALTLRRQESQGGLARRLASLGRGLLAGNRVATVLLAGGQGTRLGHPGPKGTFCLGPSPDRTLYAIHAERVAAASLTADRPIPLYVLVSPETETATRAAFADARAWGLEPEQVTFLTQRMLPVVDADGRGLLAGPGRLAMAPDGHGGLIDTLRRVGVVDDLAERGVDVLTTFQVDNPLALPLDPVMLGWMVERKLQAVGKAVRRAGPEEKVGVFARDLEGRTRVVEYSEFPEGGLPEDLKLGSIALHAFGVTWLRQAVAGEATLPFHLAHKRVPCLDANGCLQRPAEPNGFKLEQFLFDLFPLADRAEVQEVAREREFAPVKNAEGADSPASARELVAAEVARTYRAHGLEAPDPVELRPLELARRLENP
ncbi:MAG: UTP--glucose-1-phosphate uridylyltransferase [Planctomycetota bacterium]